ncbi:MAG: DNA polymerase III subunit delta' [Limosilactobacillus pontis]|uniref:DNA polymerase III subunit delta n=1 Tax=Limosilactobacillus pontis TaxID=35787 RepID=A0A2J6NNN6_9LACO|nr:DNA polymerase III subunit delta' [Limosilactobacillus pontis]PMB82930.1 DNA polymerase III subunit delta' [Limosilactobacillus pontis]
MSEEPQERSEELQPQIIARLKRILDNHELAHAYLFVGPTGSGKLAVARWLALRLFCLHPQNGEPDLTCAECQRVLSGNHPDIVTAAATGRQIKVDEIRHLKAEFTKSAMEGSQKLFIIRDADKMTTGAANSLLKFIEEPGPGVYILMLTTNKSAVLPTIRSRTQVIEMQPLKRAKLLEQLAAADIPKGERLVAVGLTDSIQQVQEWCADDWFKQAIIAVSQWFNSVSQANMMAFVEVQTKLVKLASDRDKQQVLLDLITLIWRDALLIANGVDDPERLHFVSEQGQMQALTGQYSMSQLLTISQLTLEIRHLLSQNINFQNIVEQLTIRIVQTLRAVGAE